MSSIYLKEKFQKEIKIKAELHKEQLKLAQKEFGGVYIAEIDMSEYKSLEIEVSEGEIAFTIAVNEKMCPHCMWMEPEFSAEQTFYQEVKVNSHGESYEFGKFTGSEKPQGPFKCLKCELVVDELDDIEISEDLVYELIVAELEQIGIKVLDRPLSDIA